MALQETQNTHLLNVGLLVDKIDPDPSTPLAGTNSMIPEFAAVAAVVLAFASSAVANWPLVQMPVVGAWKSGVASSPRGTEMYPVCRSG